MIKLLIRVFIKNYQDTENFDVRESYGVLAGFIGILCNVLLFGTKLTIGLLTSSIAITSDAFNNLSDTGSSVVAIIGAKLSRRDADIEHPFGHGRFEYIASLIISFIILMVGFELLRNSFDKIVNPVQVNFNPFLLGILVASVLIKVWMYSYNRTIGKLIQSKVNFATAADSLNDVFATSAVIITAFIGQYVSFPLDGIAGVIVSLLIMFTGFNIARDTVSILLGLSPDEEIVEKINEIIRTEKLILGMHDLRIHDYGPGRAVGSVHAELSDQNNIITAHNAIDHLEKRIINELGIDIVIHVDPLSESEIKNKVIK